MMLQAITTTTVAVITSGRCRMTADVDLLPQVMVALRVSHDVCLETTRQTLTADTTSRRQRWRLGRHLSFDNDNHIEATGSFACIRITPAVDVD